MKKSPLLILLAVSAAAAVLLGCVASATGKNSFFPDTYISGLFVGLRSGSLFSGRQPNEPAGPAVSPDVGQGVVTESPTPSLPVSTEPVSTPGAPDKTTPDKTPPTQGGVTQPPQSTPTPSVPVTTPPPIPLPPAGFKQVDKSYFDDALFIGDSRMVGLREYSGLDNSTFYAVEGLTVYKLFGNAFIESGGSKVTLESALSKRKFGKIYLMVGINELGTGTLSYFTETYRQSVARIRELQPDALIFIQGILCVTAERSDTDEYVNNRNIRERNAALSQLADGVKSFYIDVNEVMCDKNGDLNKAYTWDSCHLLGRYYELWTAFLMERGV